MRSRLYCESAPKALSLAVKTSAVVRTRCSIVSSADMVWTIEISAAVEQDIDLLFDHLADSYVGFGESGRAGR